LGDTERNSILSIILRTGWDIDGVGHVFGDSFKMHMDHTGLGHLWKSGPTPQPYWNWYKDYGWTDQQFVDFCNEAADCGCLFNGPIRDGYKDSIERIARQGHEIIIATDRPFGSSPEVSEKTTVEWFEKHGIEYDELHFTAVKSDANCDFFIDDKIENYDELIDHGVRAYLLNRPWNQVEGGDARNRVDTIEEYADAIEFAVAEGFADLTLV
jgi:hypothetical protein